MLCAWMCALIAPVDDVGIHDAISSVYEVNEAKSRVLQKHTQHNIE